LVEHALLNHLVRPQEHRLRNGDPECMGRLQTDDESEARRLLDGEVRGLARSLPFAIRCTGAVTAALVTLRPTPSAVAEA
jgi:hypothetical protein